MKVWTSTFGLVKSNVYIDKAGVDIEDFEDDPRWRDGILNSYSLSWSDWDAIVAAVEARRQEV